MKEQAANRKLLDESSSELAKSVGPDAVDVELCIGADGDEEDPEDLTRRMWVSYQSIEG